MSVKKELSIIIVTWNRKQEVIKCINSIKKQDYKGKYEIIIVDAGNDGTAEWIKKHVPHAILIKHENKGPSFLRNLAVKKATGNILWFLDSDTKMLNKQVISKAVKIMNKNPKIGVLGCEVLNNGLIKRQNTLIPFNNEGNLEFIDKESCILKNTSSLALANFITRKDLFDKLRGFDSEYFYLFEDTDYCYKINKIGYDTVCDSRIEVLHEPSSINRIASFKRFHKNRFRFIAVNNFYLFFITPLIDFLISPYIFYNRIQQLIYMKKINTNKGTVELNNNNLLLIGLKYIQGYIKGYFINLKSIKNNYQRYKLNQKLVKGFSI